MAPARRWAWAHLAVWAVGLAGLALSPTRLPGAWWVGAFVVAAVFTLVMTRVEISEESGRPAEERARWEQRLLWLGPVGVAWLLMDRGD